MTHMRQEYYGGSGLSDQDSREKWSEKGSLDTRTRARKIAQKILAEEEKVHIPPEAEKAIREKYNILL
jgi:trimethylamine--corrinoid protein Co-methyltransferase